MHQVAAYGSTAVLPRAEAAASNTLLLPIHQALSDADVDRVISEVRACTAARLGGSRAA
jgi:aminotransferase